MAAEKMADKFISNNFLPSLDEASATVSEFMKNVFFSQNVVLFFSAKYGLNSRQDEKFSSISYFNSRN